MIDLEERVTPAEALRMITLDGAYQHSEEGDPITIDAMDINQIQVMETIKEGETVFRR